MQNWKKIILSASLLGSVAVPAFAGIVINSPSNGANVSSTFTLSASASVCSSQSVSAMGFSFDNSPNNTIIASQTINTTVNGPSGTHTLHVKAWGPKGASCVSDVVVNVSSSAPSLVPNGAVGVSALQASNSWITEHDTGTLGSSTGATKLTNSPSLSGTARQFYSTYNNNGGQRYHVSFGDDESSTHFVYDAWVYLDGSAVNLANLELDMNQTQTNGTTIIFGFQCDGWSSTWDYTYNKGTAANPIDAWGHTSQPCNPRNWSRNAWHHVQVSYQRNDTGWVTYNSVYLDGVQQNINVTAYSEFALGWGPTLLTNLQVDGLGSSGSVNMYLDNVTVYRW
jgi:hypothetical protein